MKNEEREIFVSKNELETNDSVDFPQKRRKQIPEKFSPLPDELKSLLNKKFYSINEEIKFSEIKKGEFDKILQKNEFFTRISKNLEEELGKIEYQTDIEFEDMNPIKIDDQSGKVQYYLGNYNKDGKCHGFGIWTNTKIIYYGNFKNDEFHGDGLYINENGSYYFGQWKKGKCYGKGQLIQNNLVAYEGKYKNNLKNGNGVENFVDGSVYIGKFEKNHKEGNGKYIFNDGSIFEGMFKNSKIDGDGKIIWSDGKKYIGKFSKGKISGKGEIQYENGIVFEGEFVNNRKQGSGEYKWPDGMIYKGKYLNNQPIGEGIFEDKANNINEIIKYQSGKILNN